jgi:hypothetical protein
MNWLLIVGILIFSTMPLYAQRQQQNVTKLKADARNLVGIIGSDKTKTQTYCQIGELSEQLDQAVQEKDIKKAKALVEKIAELNKKMGPEFAALIDGQAFDQRFFIERLAQITDCSVIERSGPVYLVWISRNQNDRRLISLRLQCFMQFKAA